MKLIPLTQGKFSQVDDADFDWLSQWKWLAIKKRRNFYSRRWKKSSRSYIYMHRIILNPPRGMFSDHIDGNPLNNQRENLRICNHNQNNFNVGIRKDNKSGFKGVRFRDNRWTSRIRINNKEYHLGSFLNKIEAAIAYNEAAIKYHGEFARLNII